MVSSYGRAGLPGRRALVPGGTGGVGEGVVRGYLAAGADVVVPTRSQRRADEFRQVIGDAATGHLHLVVHDYTTFDGAEQLAADMEARLGGIDDVVAPIGGFWAGKRLWEIDEADWQSAFVGLATTHMAVLRACLPRLNPGGAYALIVGASAYTPAPGSGLVSMEQAALLMMQRVLGTELGGTRRVFALVLGAVRTRAAGDSTPDLDTADQVTADQVTADQVTADQVTADQVGAVAVAASAAAAVGGREIRLRSQAEVDEALALFRGTQPAGQVALIRTGSWRTGRVRCWR